MASNPSNPTYEIIFHPMIRQPTSPKGHTSLSSAQAARGAVLYQRTDTPSPPIQGKNAFHTKLLNLNQPTPTGPPDEPWLLNQKINPGGQPRVNVHCYASQLRRREELNFPQRERGCKYQVYCAVVDKDDLDEGQRALGRCKVSWGDKRLRDAVRKFREEREMRRLFAREVLWAREAMVAAAAEAEVEEAGTLSPPGVAREVESGSAAVGDIAGVPVLGFVGDESDVAAHQDPSEVSSVPLPPAPKRRPPGLVAQAPTEIPSIIVTDTEVEKENPCDASTVLFLPRPKRGSSRLVAQYHLEIPNITVTGTEADEKKTSEAVVVALPLRPKRSSFRLILQDDTEILNSFATDTEAEK